MWAKVIVANLFIFDKSIWQFFDMFSWLFSFLKKIIFL